MKPIINSKNQYGFKRNNDFVWFICQLFGHLHHMEKVAKIIAEYENKLGEGLIPKNKKEVSLPPSYYSGLHDKFTEWFDSEEETISLNSEEMEIFKEIMEAVYKDHIKENDWSLPLNTFVKYYEKHFAQ